MYEEYEKIVDKLYISIFTGEFKLDISFWNLSSFSSFLLMKDRKAIRINSKNIIPNLCQGPKIQYYNLKISQNLNRISKI